MMQTEIITWTEDLEDYDPWVTADQADQVAAKSEIRISRDKELTHIAVDGDEVIGAVWSSFLGDVFDFDVAVDPAHRSGRLGLKLIDRVMGDYHALRQEFPQAYIRLWVVNPKLVRVLERRYGFEIESLYEGGSAHMRFDGRLGPLQIKWVEALESGRYQQTSCQLRVGDSYCCLGVAAEHVLGIEPEYEGGTARYEGQCDTLRDTQMQAIGLSHRGSDRLIKMNDNQRLSFREIARVIKAEPSRFFEETK